MQIISLIDTHMEAAAAFFNTVIKADALVYAPLSREGFEAAFYTDMPRIKRSCALLTDESGKIRGFAGGSYNRAGRRKN